MRQGVREEGKEGLMRMLPDELQGTGMYGVGRIHVLLLVGIHGQVYTFKIVPQMVGIVVVSQRLTVVAKEVVEAHTRWVGG